MHAKTGQGGHLVTSLGGGTGPGIGVPPWGWGLQPGRVRNDGLLGSRLLQTA